MKKEILLLLFISLTLQGFNQNYNPVNPEWIYYYEPTIAHQIFLKETKSKGNPGQKYIKGVRIDSIDNENGSTIYYLQKELELDKSHPEWGCSDLYLLPCNGWLGSKIVNTGIFYVFFNDNNDSIFIISDAWLHDSWSMYKSDNLTIKAEISKIDTISFLGVTDSVKFIEIRAYDSNQVLLNIKTLQEPLILSQNHGFVKLYNFKFFPDTSILKQKLFPHYLVGIPEKNLGISILTNEDVYNYEIGDELHIYSNSNDHTETYRIKTCIGKTITQHSDSIIYTFRDIQKNIEGSNYVSISITNRTLAYPSLNLPVIGVSKLPLEATTEPQPYNPLYYYVFYRNNMNKLVIEHYDAINNWQEGCPTWSRSVYIEGVGKLYKSWHWYPSSYYDASEYLLYYKIGNEEWGEPIVINTNILITGKESCTIFPNPTDGEIYVNNDPDEIPKSISVISTSGRVLYEKSKDINTTEIINVRGNKPGIYFLIISFKNSVIREKVILI